ncbi:hypothetical protein WJX72_002459 [[Myrmecia] bisecta]|uniref:CAP-Gly domain-containing protein n=1 Tax=[Myrmecia] bisecta TaxID=41462 RepID=A0AAW1PDE1_9CHLO
MSIALDTRVVANDQKATIRYVGPVAGQEGDWIGLEWDDPSRGKHDGSTAGQQYFQCLYSRTGGSFLRKNKFDATAELGITITAALRLRYQGQDSDQNQVDGGSQMFVQTATNRKVEVKLVGQEKLLAKQGKLEELTGVALVDARVASLGPPGELASVAPRLEELDLSANLLPSWHSVAALADELPRLTVLNLSLNRMRFPDATSALPAQRFGQLHTLVFNQCWITWAQVVAVAGSAPGLRELHLCGNAICSLQAPGTAQQLTSLSQLQVLDLEDNGLSEWQEVEQLAGLPCLERLLLSGNQLTEVHYPLGATAGQDGPFAALKSLLLGENRLASWASVDALNQFPCLREVRLTGNPLLASSQGGGRYEIIARVANLTMVNASAVRQHERRDSELRYLRLVLADAEAAPDVTARQHVLAQHPQLQDLKDRFVRRGQVHAGVGGTALAASMLELRLTCVAPSAGNKMGTQTKKIPASLTVGKLKLLCERLFKLPVARQALFLRVAHDPMPENIGSDDSHDLGFWDVQSGAELLVDEFDAAAKQVVEQRAKQEQAAQRNSRMAQQLKDIQLMKSVQEGQQTEALAAIAARQNQLAA